MGEQLTAWAQMGIAVGTLAMLGVWATYLTLAYAEYKEQRRPWIVLHEAGDGDPSTACLLVNMSPYAAHVSMVHAVVRTDEASLACRLRNNPSPAGSGAAAAGLPGYQEGPLASGQAMFLGTFGDLFDALVRTATDDDTANYDRVRDVELRVVTASPVRDKGPLGARRRFELLGGGSEMVRPVTPRTEQMRGRKKRAEVAGWVEQGWQRAAATGMWRIDDSVENTGSAEESDPEKM